MLLPSLLLAAQLAAAAEPRQIQIAPSHGPFVYASAPDEKSSCTISSKKPLRAELVSETETHFEVKWITPLAGCYYERVFGSLSKKQGFVRKEDVTWEDESSDDMPVVASVNTPAENAAVPPAPCPAAPESVPIELSEPQTTGSIAPPPANLGGISGIGNLLQALKRNQAGIKPPQDIDKYMECFPYGDDGRENYRRYRKFLDVAADNFRVTIKDQPIEVNPTLMACLFRRESGYDPKNTTHTDAVGLGQHTSINIKDISQRLSKKGSWESALWKSYFARIKADPEGRRLLYSCKGSAKNGDPVFNSKEDAKCPLQSIAASHIYNLLIQRELMRSSKTNHVEWEQELEYQLAIGGSYNLGNGAAREAVQNLFVGGWLKAILRKSSKKEKQEEVASHVSAIRNCMQAGNWKPMAAKDQPKCENFPGRVIAGKR